MLLAQETATWIAVGLAVGAAVLALVLAGVVVAILARRRTPRQEMERLVEQSGSRFDEVLRDLTEALDRAREEGRRSRQLSEIAASIDLDSVLSRALELAAGLPGVDAALIVLPAPESGPGKEPLIAALGMSSEEAARQPVTGPPDGRGARAIRIGYSYSAEQIKENGELVRGGLAVPLRDDEGEQIGTLAVFWRGRDHEPSDEDVGQLEDLARSAGPAVENARRFREARQLADLDALTNLHNRRYFHETLAREASRAHRYDRRLALVVFDIDDFKAINDQVGHLAGDAVLAAVAERVRSVVRAADIACRVGGDEFAVILPESTTADAEQLYRRVQFAVASRPVGPFERLHLSAGIAELRPDDDGTTFFERADEALYRAKESGKGQFVAADGVG
jgi:diguanylate cyclase (GGDEF)-like protein